MSDETPNTGSIRGDFELLLERTVRAGDELISNDLVLRVALEAAHDAELAAALDDLLLRKGRQVVSAILQQAAARGEVAADRDWSLVADALIALGLLRVMNGQTADAKFWREVIDTLILPAVYAPVSTSPATTRRSPKPRSAH